MRVFKLDQIAFLVPLKCGLTAFRNSGLEQIATPTPPACDINPAEIDPLLFKVMIVRSPFRRVESFFKDKLRQNINPDKLEDCQNIVAGRFGNLNEISWAKYLADVVPFLAAHPVDRHLTPFTTAYPCDDISAAFNIDNALDSQIVFRLIGIKKENEASYNKTVLPYELIWTAGQFESVAKIYAKDLQLIQKHCV